MNFDGVIGQKSIIDNLSNQIKNKKFNHAYMFIGQKGMGKKLLAFKFALNILCKTNNLFLDNFHCYRRCVYQVICHRTACFHLFKKCLFSFEAQSRRIHVSAHLNTKKPSPILS